MPFDLQSLKDSAASGSKYIGDLIAPYRDNITTGLAGTALAGGASALMTNRREDESDEEYRSRLFTNTAIGAGAGGIAGTSLGQFVAPAIRDSIYSPAPVPGDPNFVGPLPGAPGVISRTVTGMAPSNSTLTAGAIAGTTVYGAGNFLDRLGRNKRIDDMIKGLSPANGKLTSGLKYRIPKQGPLPVGSKLSSELTHLTNKEAIQELSLLRSAGMYGRVATTGERIGAATSRLHVGGKKGLALGTLSIIATLLAPKFIGSAIESGASTVKDLATPDFK